MGLSGVILSKMTFTMAVSGMDKNIPATPHIAPPIKTTTIDTSAFIFTLLATILGTIKLLSISCITMYSIKTHSASIGLLVAMAISIGILMATRPPIYGIKFNKAPMTPINTAYSIPRISNPAELSVAPQLLLIVNQ